MEAVSPPAGRVRALHALRSRDFRLLWSGQTISLVGDGAFLVALGWTAFSLTGKTSSLAIVLMLHSVAMLATLLIGGALADRYPRRTLMIVSDLARCGVITAVPSWTLRGTSRSGSCSHSRSASGSATASSTRRSAGSSRSSSSRTSSPPRTP
jgi:MFS family permease